VGLDVASESEDSTCSVSRVWSLPGCIKYGFRAYGTISTTSRVLIAPTSNAVRWLRHYFQPSIASQRKPVPGLQGHRNSCPGCAMPPAGGARPRRISGCLSLPGAPRWTRLRTTCRSACRASARLGRAPLLWLMMSRTERNRTAKPWKQCCVRGWAGGLGRRAR
jgi:hypothetical protein